MRFLNNRNLQLEKDIIDIASIVFNIETAYRMGLSIENVDIEVSEDTARCNLGAIKKEIEDLLLFVLMKEIDINFIVKDKSINKRSKNINFDKYKNVCLFSGGIDSLSGLLTSKKYFKDDICAVFIAHNDQPRAVNIVNNLMKEINKDEKIKLYTLYAPPMRRFGYSQLRGFLYCLYSSVIANLSESNNIILTECGPTMYQPRFSPFDMITMTTHPFVLKKAKKIIQLFLKKEIDILIPFENLTKSEVIVNCPKKELLKKTHSCISVGTGRNEGCCYGCVVRRLGAIVAGIQDCHYDHNPLVNSKNVDNLISLLRFSYDFLLDRDNLLSSSKENIILYGKQRLFRRFSLDTFVALYIEKEKGIKTNPVLENIYSSFFEKMNESIIIERIEQVRNERYIPNFDKKVN